ncbi:MAG: Plasmid stabilization protein [uncultured Sulfurovum sp.]|uniref:Plasmid stabilization protein n=1 Tax=uncultured Sulfurovum sp. TaxID=269237 RepID=A0A6S6T8I2_9BACT|nr:MAG: Plasmid stabilization protein [uncultured Sulfurovum sp.]
MKEVKFLALAQNELDDIYEALEYQQENQGHRFIEEIKKMLELIQAYPASYPKNTHKTRKCLLRSFPYAIMYQSIDKVLIVVAIMNLRKKPIHWASKSVSEYSTCRISSLPETIYTR